MFGLRRKPEAAKKKYTHYNKICPFEGCYGVTKNPGEHLRGKKHGMMKTDPDYKTTLKLFKRYDPSLLEDVEITESPKKRYGVVEKELIPAKRNFAGLHQSSIWFVQIGSLEENSCTNSEFDSENDSDSSSYGKRDAVIRYQLGPTVNKLITEFHEYMVGPNRGRKSRAVEGVVYDVRRILLIAGIQDDLSLLLEDDEGLLKFVSHYENSGELRHVQIFP